MSAEGRHRDEDKESEISKTKHSTETKLGVVSRRWVWLVGGIYGCG